MNQLSLKIVKQLESVSLVNSPVNSTSRFSDVINHGFPKEKRRKSRSQLKPFLLHQKTIKETLRRKSCHCNECGQLGTFQYKCMNIKGPKPYRRSILTRRASNQQVQSAQPQLVQRIRQQLKKIKTYDESKLSALTESNNTHLTFRGIEDSMTKLHSYFHKQQSQQIKVYQLSQFTPNCSPKHLKSQKSLPLIQSYMNYRKLDSQLLKPLKLNQKPQQKQQLLTLHRTKQHQNLQTVGPI
ncbi:unnamed protein product [Paramecium sonneborni]|uniref:Uncharacterized protein n=1 Tax=Paramecium sonneborni TaxID=65129 RepID=A0A8S1QRM9_9CILI|nr:unnamed protein product [Paramecium sonneborni]